MRAPVPGVASRGRRTGGYAVNCPESGAELDVRRPCWFHGDQDIGSIPFTHPCGLLVVHLIVLLLCPWSSFSRSMGWPLSPRSLTKLPGWPAFVDSAGGVHHRRHGPPLQRDTQPHPNCHSRQRRRRLQRCAVVTPVHPPLSYLSLSTAPRAGATVRARQGTAATEGGDHDAINRAASGLTSTQADQRGHPDEPGGRQSRGEWALRCGDTRLQMWVRARPWW